MVGFLYPPTGVAVCEIDVRSKQSPSQQYGLTFLLKRELHAYAMPREFTTVNRPLQTHVCWLRFGSVPGLQLGDDAFERQATAPEKHE